MVTTRPVPIGGDVRHADFKDVEVETNTVAGLREAVRNLAKVLGATVVSAVALAFFCWAALGASVETAKLNDLDLDGDPSVVVGVSLEGLATTGDVARVVTDATNALAATTLEYEDAREISTRATVSAEIAAATNATMAAAKDYADGLLAALAVEATAARVASNTVETVLAPRAIEYHYGDDTQDQAFILPNWATSAWRFVRDGGRGEPGYCGTARIFSNGPLRNYSFVVEEIPDDVAVRTMTLSFHDLRATHKIYATPAFRDIEDPRVPDAWGWLLTTNDVPCVVTVREPEAGLLIVRRDRLGGEEATGYLTIEDGRPVIWGRR